MKNIISHIFLCLFLVCCASCVNLDKINIHSVGLGNVKVKNFGSVTADVRVGVKNDGPAFEIISLEGSVINGETPLFNFKTGSASISGKSDDAVTVSAELALPKGSNALSLLMTLPSFDRNALTVSYTATIRRSIFKFTLRDENIKLKDIVR